jgi:hypothetical protein
MVTRGGSRSLKTRRLKRTNRSGCNDQAESALAQRSDHSSERRHQKAQSWPKVVGLKAQRHSLHGPGSRVGGGQVFEIFTVIGGSVAATLIANYVWSQFRSKLTIRRVTRQDAPEVAGMLELYGALFPDEERDYSNDHILSLLADRHGHLKRKHTPCVDIILTAQHGKSVIGFVFCHYYPGSTHAVVSYCGRDSQSEISRTRDAVGQLLAELLRTLRKQKPACTMLVFEVGDKKVRSVFRQRAIQLGFQARELLIEYRRPRYSLEAHSEGDPLHLLCVPLSGPATSGVITRDTAVSILSTLHLLGYGDFYEPTDPRHELYQKYLGERVSLYRDRLPDPVPVA